MGNLQEENEKLRAALAEAKNFIARIEATWVGRLQSGGASTDGAPPVGDYEGTLRWFVETTTDGSTWWWSKRALGEHSRSGSEIPARCYVMDKTLVELHDRATNAERALAALHEAAKDAYESLNDELGAHADNAAELEQKSDKALSVLAGVLGKVQELAQARDREFGMAVARRVRDAMGSGLAFGTAEEYLPDAALERIVLRSGR